MPNKVQVAAIIAGLANNLGALRAAASSASTGAVSRTIDSALVPFSVDPQHPCGRYNSPWVSFFIRWLIMGEAPSVDGLREQQQKRAAKAAAKATKAENVRLIPAENAAATSAPE